MGIEKTDFKHVVIVGFGDIGQRVAALWRGSSRMSYASLHKSIPGQNTVSIFGLARSEDKQVQMQAEGIIPVQADLDNPASLTELPVADGLIYWFAPPPGKGASDPRMAHFLTAIEGQGKPKRIVAISTTGIYGDQQGGWVNEETPPNPQVDRARRRLDMETQLRDWGEQQQVPVIILRVGGIYGPDRLPLQRIRDGVPVLKQALAPKTNRIHADDLAQVCVAVASKPAGSRIYNVSDGQDSNMTEYFFTLADYFDLPRPPEVDWAEAEETISQGMLSYLRESRRMDTTRMQQELAIQLRYPSLLDGLQAMAKTPK